MSTSSQEWELVSLASMLASGACPEMYLSYGIAALKGRCAALTDAAVAVPSFTLMSPLMGMDYFGVSDGFFGAYSAKHLMEQLHVAVAKGIEEELVAEAPRFLNECRDDVEGWWRKLFLDAFRVVDDELVARVAGGVAVGSPAAVALVMKDYLVLANRGATCRAVIYRGEEAVQLTSDSERRSEPYEQKEQQDVQDEGGHESTNMTTSEAILFRPYFPKPEILMVKREPRDKFLILATGGVWDHVTPAEACRFLQQRLHISRITMSWEMAFDDRGSPNILAKELAELAIRKGSQRNVTVAIIPFKNFWDERHP